MKSILNLLIRLRMWLFPTALERANNRLAKATRQEIKSRKKLRREIERYAEKKFGYKFGSKYIPNKGYNKQLIYDNVHHEYADQMKKYSIRLTKNLVWA